jgi:uncharacterized membrane protein
MTTNLSRLYNNYEEAQRVVAELEAAGIPADDISLLANSEDGLEPATDVTEAASAGAGMGAAVGGGAGLLAGLGVMAIPGVGPVVAAGWLAATLTGMVAGAVTGAAAGGIVGALVDSGVDERDAHVYAESLRRGGSVVLVKTSDERRATVTKIFDRHMSVEVDDRRSTYEGEGWSAFDDKRGPYNPREARDPYLTMPRSN